MPAEKAPEGQDAALHELNLTGQPVGVRHADVVNVYNAPVTINNNYVAPAAEVPTD